ncbi:histidine triad nucleotide-binding protein [Oleiharenicola lentus]|uniref:histidine triad nucleotide-binding protein n=1 Tax=Oleiharenicola lentus TaxID=2508720 RepID=UPI003F67BA56
MRLFSILTLSSGLVLALHAGSPEYAAKKTAKLAAPSPFEAIIAGKTDTQLVYQDELCVAFVPLRRQAPVHLLIVPKKRINTLNDVSEADTKLLGHLLVVAKQLAREQGIAESGYRLTFNTNEDSGQSVFHIHLHLLGGMPLGPMLPQTYVDPAAKAEK